MTPLPTRTDRPLRVLASETAFSCPWYRVRRDRLLAPDGSEAVYNVVEKNEAVWIIPVTAAGEVALIHHYRHTVDAWCWEIPAGTVHDGQTPEEAGRQELREEIGGVAASWEYVGPFFTWNGISNEVGHVFLASGVELGETAPEPIEVLDVHLRPALEVLELARGNAITDAPSALALLLAEPRLRELAAGRKSVQTGRVSADA